MEGYIVNKQNIFQVTIDNSEIFDVESLLAFPAAVPEISVGNKSFLIDVVDDHICIALMAGSKHDEFILFCQFWDALAGIWSDVDSGFDSSSVRKLDGKQNITRQISIFIAVDKSFVKIKDQGRFGSRRQMSKVAKRRQRFIHSFDVLQDIYGSSEMVFAKLIKTSGIWCWVGI